jgi:glutamate synthase (NADPH/NADH) large chain/glutamate synthase (ferredoxin)
MVSLQKVLSTAEQTEALNPSLWHRGISDEDQLKQLLAEHNRWTGSKRARELLDNWDVSRQKFVKVFPNEYKRALGELHAKKSTLAQAAQAKAAIKKEAAIAK